VDKKSVIHLSLQDFPSQTVFSIGIFNHASTSPCQGPKWRRIEETPLLVHVEKLVRAE
jgi:hypothetical protein